MLCYISYQLFGRLDEPLMSPASLDGVQRRKRRSATQVSLLYQLGRNAVIVDHYVV